MPEKFQSDVHDTIDRCSRLARATPDMDMTSKLLSMADDLEKAMQHSAGRVGKATRPSED
jgi:hypothetical protein